MIMSFVYAGFMIAASAILCADAEVYGLGQRVSGGSWSTGIHDLRPSLNLTVKAYDSPLLIPKDHIYKRVREYAHDPRIEPITLSVNTQDETSIRRIAQSYALNPHLVEALAVYLQQSPHGVYPLSPKKQKKSPHLKRVIIGADGLSLMDITKLQQRLSSPSIRLEIQPSQSEYAQKQQLLSQIRSFVDPQALEGLRNRLMGEKSMAVGIKEPHFLPLFAQRMLRRHVYYRGPNCFHAAMAFQDSALITMSRTNLRREPHHHRLMINHDELWHILNWYFYEVDPAKSKLKYGDVIVFLDVPRTHADHKPADHFMFVHASAYLFNNFVFSKGSKSPNTAYTIKTLEQEMETWSRHANRLVLKVYRKNYVNLSKKSVILSRNDWLQ